jgi:MoaA/NifB/PqqE/SkfB family radical SAM enzyme
MEMTENNSPPDLAWKLWIYTNFDCNLSCSYCVAESTPRAPRNAIGLDNACRIVDEAVDLGFRELFFTGGEPFILEEIYEMLAYASSRLKTTVLTNAMLFNGRRLSRLCEIANPNLFIQVSLDGGRAEHHDAYRGAGTWNKTVAGIRVLQENGFAIRLSSTETPANSEHLDELHDFRRSLGISAENHFVRPLAKRGFSTEGMDVGPGSLIPEVTVTRNGIYWHPLASPSSRDMLVTKDIFPLSAAVTCIRKNLTAQPDGVVELIEFT